MAQPRILVVFHTAEGQSGRVANRIAEVLAEEGSAVDVARAEDEPSPGDYDAVVAGDSLHNRRHSTELIGWLSEYRTELAAKPTALFQVSLGSATRWADQMHRFVEELEADTGFEPDIVGEFGGRLAYTTYGWMTRRTMQLGAKAAGLDADTSQDTEYTDWDAVERFARDVHAFVVGALDRAGAHPA